MSMSRSGFTVEDGIGIQDAVAPSYSALRPLNPVEPGIFPVYPDLVDALLKPSNPFSADIEHPDRTVAHALATCSGYAYSDAHTLSTMMARMGLANNRCRMIGTYVNAMLIESTAFVVQSEDGRVVILAYRGTDPSNVINLLTDVDIHPDQVAFDIGDGGPYGVHAGFYRNTRATRFKVAEALLRAKYGHPVTGSGGHPRNGEPPRNGEVPSPGPLEPMQALYITGHSLGAAMAAIESIMLRTEPNYEWRFTEELRATYTFAQPLVGSPELAAACNGDGFLREQVLRFVYQRDPVPHYPPLASGPFRNFGREFQFSGGGWRETTTVPAQQSWFLVEQLGGLVAFAARQFPLLNWIPFPYQIDDHLPQHYIAALTPPGVRSEFGDYDYTGT
jgi:hypothetical protein